ncbi:MAG: HAD family hydrolase [Methanoregula sp.]|nr:HAD family hydrolase [Methanoregula sp.]
MIDLAINGTTIKEIDLIIFDKDGTLFELYPYWTVVARRRAENICRAMHVSDESLVNWIVSIMGVDNEKRVMNPQGPIGIYNRTYIQNLVLEELQKKEYLVDPQMILGAFQETDVYISQDHILKQSLVPVRGLMEFLSGIAQNCQCAIFSYDQTINLEHITRLMQIDNYFSYLLGGDQLKYPKPDPWGAVKIMDDLHVSPAHTLLIGDSIHDIESGKKAGCKFVITRRSDISDLTKLNPLSDFIIDDYTSIIPLQS